MVFRLEIAVHYNKSDKPWLEKIQNDTYLPQTVRKAAAAALTKLQKKEKDEKEMKDRYPAGLRTYRVQMEEDGMRQVCPSLGSCPMPKKCPGIRKRFRVQVP